MEGKIIPSIILAAGFIGGVALFGNQVGNGVNALLNKDRIVTVKGLCEKEVKANHVSELLGVAYTQIRNPDSNLSLLGRS